MSPGEEIVFDGTRRDAQSKKEQKDEPLPVWAIVLIGGCCASFLVIIIVVIAIKLVSSEKRLSLGTQSHVLMLKVIKGCARHFNSEPRKG